MAKITNCSFCGKELTKGIFKGDDYYLDLGMYGATCCEDCYNKRKNISKPDKKRIETKLDNFKRATKNKPSEKDIAIMFDKYFEEKGIQEEKCGAEVPDVAFGCFCCNSAGYFSVREYSMTFSNQDVSAKSMIKSLDKAVDTQCICFDKNDITKIEYAKIGSGDPLGLFATAYSFAIRLNDEKIMTYKPCITRTAMVGRGLFFGHQKSAEKRLIDQLNEFKKAIGSDLPIVKVKKI